jgi:hypothetical protein
MSTDATDGTTRSAPATSGAPEQVGRAGNGNGLLHGHRHHWGGHPPQLIRTEHRWRDPGGVELLRSTLAGWVSAVSLTLLVLTSLLLVSLASGHFVNGVIVPSRSGQLGPVPSWLSGPTGVLTSWFAVSARDERVIFTVAIPVMLLAYVLVAFCAPRLRVRWVVAAIVAVHVIFLLAPPFNLSDVFNYLNYGRMEVVHQLNPYVTIPALEPHTDPTFALSNWHGLLSPYGPLFTLFTMALAPLGVAGSFWAMKVALMLASLATVFLVYRCATMLGRSPLTAAVIVGMNPIVLAWGLGGDHNDFFMIFFFVLGFWLLLRADMMRVGRYARPQPPGRGMAVALRRGWAWLDGMPRPLVAGEPAAWMEIAAGVALVAAVAIKASAVVLIPVAVAGAGRRTRVALGVVIGLVAAAAMTYGAFGLNLPNIAQQDKLVVPDGIPNLIGLALGLGGATDAMRSVLTVILLAVTAAATVFAWRTRRWRVACGWVTLTFVLTLTWTLPWYIAWLLPFAALSRSRGLRVAVAVIAVYTYLVFMPYSNEALGFLHIYPTHTIVGQQEQTYENSLLF